MTYGLYVEGGNGVLQIDSDNTYMEGLGVKYAGPIQANSTGLTGVAAGDIVYFRLNSSAWAPASGDASWVTPKQTGSAITFKGSDYATLSADWRSVDVLHLGRQSLGTGTLSGSYGLQIKNSAGTANIFDSRALTSGFSITSYIPFMSVQGFPLGGSSSNKLSSSLSTYVSTAPGRGYQAAERGGFLFANGHSSLGTGVYFYATNTSSLFGTISLPNFASFTIGESF
tara:strand:+ start:508 stop:1188 length:681 start_codon:yes stop_codon:yes gene_type:complete